MIKKPNLSSVVKSQLPEFVREDYQTFIAFLEAYYEFLKQNYDINLLEVRDIDNTLEDFVKYFKNEFAKDIPETLINDRFLIKNLKDYYLSKGSEVSFQILLALLFAKNVTVDYPSRQMLRASDGKWNQDVSVFAKVTAGNPSMVVGRIVDIVTPTRIIRVQVDKTQNVEIEVDRVRKVAPDIYEFFIDRRFFGNINVGDRMRYSNLFDATIVSTTSSIKVQRPGKHFKPGDLYEIKNGAGIGSVIKISSVDSHGSILSLEFVKFGIGYTTEFTTTLIPTGGTSLTTSGATELNIGGIPPDYTIGLAETTNGFFEQGYINRSDYNSQAPSEIAEEGPGPAWDGTYVGNIVREFFVDSKYVVLDPDEPAIIRIGLGPLTKYPGYYTSNDGFLDDAIFIQDSRYYQAFSYVLKIDERLESYKSVVKTLLHPSGMALFGEYDLRNEFDLGTSLESMIKFLTINLQDNVIMTQSEFTFKYIHKEIGLDASEYFEPIDEHVYVLTKPLNTHNLNDDLTADDNTVTPSDQLEFKDFGKYVNATLLNDGLTLDDNTVTPSENTIDYGYSDLTRTGISTLNTTKILNSVSYNHYFNDGVTLDSDLVTSSDSFGPKDISKSLATHYLNNGITADTSSVTMSDTYSTVLNKSISATTLNYDGNLDNETITATGSGSLWLSPYTDPYPITSSYFANDSGNYTTGESAFTG